MQLGVIADDFTGATDIASFLVNYGMSTIQLNGVPQDSLTLDNDVDAVVISLKSRSCPVNEAVEQSVAALKWLQQQGCKQFYFKYCSTFDSTSKGNIGPVTDALLDALDEKLTIISPALPVNGRTIYQGYLFVMAQLLSDSGMRHHPINPMTDSSLIRLMESQSKGKCGLIPFNIIESGANAVSAKLDELKNAGYRYVVLDTLTEKHLLTQGEAVRDMKLVTGGSGLAIGLAKQWAKPGVDSQQAQKAGQPQGDKSVILSGSCSVMTNKQVAAYQNQAPSFALDIEKCLIDDNYINIVNQWVIDNSSQSLAPLVYATTSPENLASIQNKWGIEKTSIAVESFFANLAKRLVDQGYNKIITAGGETSSIIVQTLSISGFHIGPTIAPGVPWVRAIDKPLSLSLKSGNFGDETFFIKAQKEF